MEKIKYLIYRLKWGAAKIITPTYPLNVDIELSSVCNLKCSFCPHSENDISFERKFMDFSTIRRIVDQIEGKVPAIKLNLRGEATLHPRFTEICDYVRGKFLDIRLNTNGNYDTRLNNTIATTFTNICFSVDSFTDLTYLKIKLGGDYELLWDNIYTMIHRKSNIVLSFVITEQNKHEVEDFKKDCAYFGIKTYIRRGVARTKDSKHIIQEKQEMGRKNCYMPNRRLTVTSSGNIFPCCVATWNEKRSDLILGNIKKDNIMDVWNAYKIQHLRHDLKNNDFHFEACRKCLSRESYVY